MKKHNDNQRDLDHIEHILDNSPIPPPGDEMDKKFYALLERSKKREPEQHNRSQFVLPLAWKVAAGIALFVGGWLGGALISSHGTSQGELAQLNGEINQLKQNLVLTMMDQRSSVDRIQAVNLVNELDQVDEQIIESLVSTLNYDENDNVRLVALESLMSYADQAIVRTQLVRSIEKQKSPLVLMRLAEVMLKLQEKAAADAFQDLLQKPDLNYSLRTQINETIEKLS